MDKALMKTIEKQDAATRTTRAGFTAASFQLLGKPAMSVASSAFFGSQMGFYWLRRRRTHETVAQDPERNLCPDRPFYPTDNRSCGGKANAPCQRTIEHGYSIFIFVTFLDQASSSQAA
jgi:hypothetical protein